MDEKQVESIREQFSWYETTELLKIWQAHNTKEWTNEAFEAIRQILITRVEVLPPYENTDAAENLLEQARIFYGENEFEEGLAICDQAIQTAPHLSEAHFLKGMILDEMDRLDEAIASLQTAIRLDPSSSPARKYLRLVKDEIIQKTVTTEERILTAMCHGSAIVLPYGIAIASIAWILERNKSKLISSEWIFFGAILFLLCLLFLFILCGIVGAVYSHKFRKCAEPA